jgi:hypothetical protein
MWTEREHAVRLSALPPSHVLLRAVSARCARAAWRGQLLRALRLTWGSPPPTRSATD